MYRKTKIQETYLFKVSLHEIKRLRLAVVDETWVKYEKYCRFSTKVITPQSELVVNIPLELVQIIFKVLNGNEKTVLKDDILQSIFYFVPIVFTYTGSYCCGWSYGPSNRDDINPKCYMMVNSIIQQKIDMNMRTLQAVINNTLGLKKKQRDLELMLHHFIFNITYDIECEGCNEQSPLLSDYSSYSCDQLREYIPEMIEQHNVIHLNIVRVKLNSRTRKSHYGVSRGDSRYRSYNLASKSLYVLIGISLAGIHHLEIRENNSFSSQHISTIVDKLIWDSKWNENLRCKRVLFLLGPGIPWTEKAIAMMPDDGRRIPIPNVEKYESRYRAQIRNAGLEELCGLNIPRVAFWPIHYFMYSLKYFLSCKIDITNNNEFYSAMPFIFSEAKEYANLGLTFDENYREFIAEYYHEKEYQAQQRRHMRQKQPKNQ